MPICNISKRREIFIGNIKSKSEASNSQWKNYMKKSYFGKNIAPVHFCIFPLNM